jgi:hypothetical protein
MEDFPELPVFLTRKTNGIVTDPLPKQRQPRTRKPKGEVLRLYLLNKRGFADGYHRGEFITRANGRVRIRIGKRTTTVPSEQWDRAHAKYHGREYNGEGRRP